MIAPGVALTATRCALFPCASASLTVLTRPCRLSSPQDGSEIFPVATIRVHPDYSNTTFENDIAVILLDRTTAVDQPLLRISEDPPPQEGQFPHADGLGAWRTRARSSLTLFFADVLRVLQNTEPIPNTTVCSELIRRAFSEAEGEEGFESFTDGLGRRRIPLIFDHAQLCVVESENEGPCLLDEGVFCFVASSFVLVSRPTLLPSSMA